MKKVNFLVILSIMAGLLTACGNQTETAENLTSAPDAVQEVQAEEPVIPENPNADPDSDIDLTTLSSTMVYSQVADMMYTPEKYIGKVVKAKGQFSVYHDNAQDKDYFAVLIKDAAACCSQGIEFVWDGEHVYPDDYPEIGKEITVMGTFDTYEEDGATYCQLLQADVSA